MPTAIAAARAARISSGADIVSIHATSAPPAARPEICSVNDCDASLVGKCAERREELAGRPDGARHDDGA